MQACGRLVARMGEQDVDRDIGAGIELEGGVMAPAMGDLDDPAIDDRYVAARQIGPDIGRNVVTSGEDRQDRKSTRLNSSHGYISYAVFCLKKKKKSTTRTPNKS